jgi:hypothetical protein
MSLLRELKPMHREGMPSAANRGQKQEITPE